MRTGQSKAMWQCKLHNLVANFGTNARDVTWWPNFEPICKKSENAYLEEIQNWNIANLKMTNTRISQSRFSGQREQTCVLILISSWRGWTCSCTPLNPSSGTWSTLLYQNDSIHHQAEIQSGEACVLTKEDMPSSFSYASWWPTLQTMKMATPYDKILNQSKLCHLLTKFASGAISWPNLQLIMQEVLSGGQICN